MDVIATRAGKDPHDLFRRAQFCAGHRIRAAHRDDKFRTWR